MILRTLKRSGSNGFCFIAFCVIILLLSCFAAACKNKSESLIGDYTCFATSAGGVQSKYHLALMNDGDCVFEIGIPYMTDVGNDTEIYFFTCADAKYDISSNIISVTDITVNGVKAVIESDDKKKVLKEELGDLFGSSNDLGKLENGDMISYDSAKMYGVPVQNVESAAFCFLYDDVVMLKRSTNYETHLTVDDHVYDCVEILSQFREGRIFLESAFRGEETVYTKDYYPNGNVKLITYYKNGIISQTVRYDENGEITAEPVYQ